MKTTTKDKLIDTYLEHPLFFDCIILIILFACEFLCRNIFLYFNFSLIKVLGESNMHAYASSVLNTIVSLIGFMVAALTIMITVKASLKARGYSDSNNALEYIFTTTHYFKIVDVFTNTIVELVVLLIAAYIGWLSASNISLICFSKLLFCITLGIILSVMRSIYIFFKILKLEKLIKDNKSEVESTEEKHIRLLEEILKNLSERK